jgi:hypothetical protein
MNSNKQAGRVAGILLLLVFIAGILIYQFLRGPIVFADNYLENTALQSNKIIASVLLAFLSGTISIIISVILLPVFKQYSERLAYLYVAFCIVNLVAIAFENYGALALMEVSNEFITNGLDNKDFLQSMGTVFYRNHRWAHFMYLLISCLPVFILYYTLFYCKLIPRAISIFGIIATLLMFVQIICSIFEINTTIDLLIPIGLVQFFLPIWLITKGIKDREVN